MTSSDRMTSRNTYNCVVYRLVLLVYAHYLDVLPLYDFQTSGLLGPWGPGAHLSRQYTLGRDIFRRLSINLACNVREQTVRQRR